MAASSGLGMCVAQDSTAYNDPTGAFNDQLTYMKNIGINNVQINIIDYRSDTQNTPFRDKMRACCTQALSRGFWTEWGYTANGQTINSTILANMQTAWASLAVWAQSVGLNRIVFGNEEDLRIDGSTVTQTSLMNAQIASAQAAIAAGYTGSITSKITTNVYSQWKANVANWQSYMTLGVDLYNTTSAFISNVNDIATNLSNKAYVAEWNTNGGLTDFVDEFDWEQDLKTRYIALANSGISKYFYFAWSVGGSEKNKWSVIPEGSTNYRDLVQMFARKRRWFWIPDTSANNQPISTSRQKIKDFGTCLSFSNSTDIVQLGTSNPFTGSFYFSAWVNWGGITGNFQSIFAKRNSYLASDLMFDFNAINTTGLLAVDTVTSYVQFGVSLPTAKWVHICWVHDTTLFKDKLYINSALVSNQNSATLGTGTSAPITIGGDQNPGQQNFKGFIDEVAIGTTIPTQEQVIAMKCRFDYPSLWTYLNFDEGSGSTAIDFSGNGNNGTITGATYSSNVAYKPRNIVTNSRGIANGRTISS